MGSQRPLPLQLHQILRLFLYLPQTFRILQNTVCEVPVISIKMHQMTPDELLSSTNFMIYGFVGRWILIEHIQLTNVAVRRSETVLSNQIRKVLYEHLFSKAP